MQPLPTFLLLAQNLISSLPSSLDRLITGFFLFPSLVRSNGFLVVNKGIRWLIVMVLVMFWCVIVAVKRRNKGGLLWLRLGCNGGIMVEVEDG